MSDPAQPAPDLECENVTKVFGAFTAVSHVSFAVPKGSFFSILGPSGCGKTTIMRMIAGFLDLTGGDILIKGRSVLDVAPNKRPVNMVFQHLALFPMMNVADNIGYGLRRRGLPRAEIAGKVDAVLERVGLPGAGPKHIDQLSGGQKQRIAIARCMVLDPDVLLLDEPLGALDLKLRDHMKVELKKLQSQFDTTFVYITHDQSEALVMSDQIAVMNHGVFEQIGTAHELYYDPVTAFVAGFVGDSNRWRGRIEAADAKGARVIAKGGFPIVAGKSLQVFEKGDEVDIFVRPEAIVIAFDAKGVGKLDNRLQGTVGAVLFNGANSRALIRDHATGAEIDVALPQTGEFADLKPGREVHLGWGQAQARCFGASDDLAAV
ncbi:Spermidine/putrescine import ABC transporter ATP-binding protein PotA (TC 3.A.1.11.1) [hydrothermal vent metagenome]|uniref:Spermidine/putrescine import ABC transporter ATP-binding protein PotA (TC 3.A.1.11.1) n=1 Tax=hydrothermal vent metagenome TaxID=652676 RepID=A0A3B0TFW7_9ZZZZ